MGTTTLASERGRLLKVIEGQRAICNPKKAPNLRSQTRDTAVKGLLENFERLLGVCIAKSVMRLS